MASVGVDTWGVDFGLLDARGRLLANPVHYRDGRTEGMPELAFAVVPRDEIYAATGIQFMPINTLYQLYSMVRAGDPLLGQADRLLMMADLFHHFLAGQRGRRVHDREHQPVPGRGHPRLGAAAARAPRHPDRGSCRRSWRRARCWAPSVRTWRRRRACATRAWWRRAPTTPPPRSSGAPLAGPTTAFLSSGTWSLIGLEMPEPGDQRRSTLAANLTNEGGVGGTIRLLRNVMGLWLVQESRRALWPAGDAPSYEELAALAEAAPAFTAFIDPDDERFLRPGDLPARVRAFCAETGQPVPPGHGDPDARAPREPRPAVRRGRRPARARPPGTRSRRSTSSAAAPTTGCCAG